ncbi:MAG TPA: hypothetical protein VNC50_21055, partial [Planctomycetia bacterium]|nr:hypothetical protein [Planctomycetia bacterium]
MRCLNLLLLAALCLSTPGCDILEAMGFGMVVDPAELRKRPLAPIDPDAEKLLTKRLASFSKDAGVYAAFTQIRESVSYGTKEAHPGTMRRLDPHFRLDLKNDNFLFVGGKELWHYQKQDKRALVIEFSNREPDLRFGLLYLSPALAFSMPVPLEDLRRVHK